MLGLLDLRGALRVSTRLLRSQLFKEVTAEDRDAFRRRVRTKAILGMALIDLALLAGALIASAAGIRTLDLAKATILRLRAQDLGSLKAGLIAAGGIVLGALLLDRVARAVAAVLGKFLSRSAWLAPRQEMLSDAIVRLRKALRTVILCGAAILIATTLGAPEGVLRATVLGSYVLGAFYVSRLVVCVAHLLVELLFDTSGKLANVESPLKYLSGLTHLVGITKRTVEYFVYVGAATLVADEFTPDTWPSRAGRIGIRVIAIVYASRVLVEVCAVFIREIFLGKIDKEQKASYQQRQTLVPVAMGLLRYGIYFSALVMALREASIDPTPLLAGAGVLGVAVGLGAQAFVGDIVAGFFILFEHLLLVGDLVEVSGVRGKVEEIGVRITKIRDDAGVLHAIPNGEVRKVANHSKAYVNAVVDVHVPYEEDLQRVRSLLLSVTEKVVEEETRAESPVEVKVQELNEGSIILRVIARVPPGQDEDVGDVVRARVVEGLRDAAIGAPRPRRVVLIDSGVRVGAPIKPTKKKEHEDEGPPKPFEPPKADE